MTPNEPRADAEARQQESQVTAYDFAVEFNNACEAAHAVAPTEKAGGHLGAWIEELRARGVTSVARQLGLVVIRAGSSNGRSGPPPSFIASRAQFGWQEMPDSRSGRAAGRRRKRTG